MTYIELDEIRSCVYSAMLRKKAESDHTEEIKRDDFIFYPMPFDTDTKMGIFIDREVDNADAEHVKCGEHDVYFESFRENTEYDDVMDYQRFKRIRGEQLVDITVGGNCSRISGLPSEWSFGSFACRVCSWADKIYYSDRKAFKGFAYIDVPDTVEYIEDNAFEMCGRGTLIALPAAFDTEEQRRRLGIKEGAYQDYRAAKEIFEKNKSDIIINGEFHIPYALISVAEGDKSIFSIDSGDISHVRLPSDITEKEIDMLLAYKSESLQRVSVADGNMHICSRDGVVFSKDMKKLLLYPKYRRNTSYTIPDSVESINMSVFSDCAYLDEIVLPCRFKNKAAQRPVVEGLRFADIRSFSVLENDLEQTPDIAAIDGVLYSGDKKSYLLYPRKRRNAEFEIPQGVENVCRGCSNNTYVKKLILSEDVRNISWRYADLVIPEDMSCISDRVKWNAKDVKRLDIRGNIYSVSEDAAILFSSLRIIVVSKDTEVLSDRLFKHFKCDRLKAVVLPDRLATKEHAERLRVPYGCNIYKSSVWERSGSEAESFYYEYDSDNSDISDDEMDSISKINEMESFRLTRATDDEEDEYSIEEIRQKPERECICIEDLSGKERTARSNSSSPSSSVGRYSLKRHVKNL